MSARRSPLRHRLGAMASAVAVLTGLVAGATGPAAAPVEAAAPPASTAPGLFATGTGPTTPRSVSPDATPTLAAGFTESPVFTGLTQPTVVRFAANGVVFVALKSGRIVDFTSTASNTPHLFADLSPEVDNYWDRGLLGMALAPNFPSDPSVYVMYAYDHDPVSDLHNPAWDAPTQWNDACPSPPGATNDGCPIQARIARLTAQSDGSGGYVSSGSETVLVTDDCQQFPSHSVGDLVFGPDGYLYASMGEGASFLNNAQDYGQYGGTLTDSNGKVITPANPCGDPPTPVGTAPTTPTAEGGALRAQSARRTDGPVVLNGTLMRLQTSGLGAPGNPFAGSSDPNAKRILAYGFRNPFRFTFAPGSSAVWVGDVGYNTWEEVDRVAVPNGSGTANYGWPCVEGPNAGNYYSTVAPNLCNGITSGNTVDPYYDYNHGAAVVSGDGCSGSAGSVISAVGFYEGAAYPSAYHGALFFGDHSRDCIWAMLPGGSGLPDPSNVVRILSGTAGGSCLACPVDLESGPGGNLFYVDFDGGTVNEISYATPAAVITSDVTSGVLPLTVHFDGTGSHGGAPPLTYSWDLNGDGTFGDSTSATPQYTYGTDGTYDVRLRVTDANHVTSTSAVYPITAGDTPPTPSINLIDGAAPPPQPTLDGDGDPPPVRPAGIPAVYVANQTITFAGSATDAADGTLPASALTWDIKIFHCPLAGCHIHDLQTISGVASGSFAAPQHDYPSLLEITLTAVNSHGQRTSTTVYIYPKTHVLTFQTNPTGLTVTGGGTSGPAPVHATFIQGNQISLVAPPLQTAGQTQYGFVSWSDGGAATHSLMVPSSDTTYTARYIPTSRLAGPDRYGTSAKAAAQYPAHQAVVYVASGTDFPDAAAAAAIAGQQHAPLLLVEPTAIPSSVRTQLTRLAPNRIVVLGGEVAVSASVFNQLKAFTSPLNQVARAPGADRYATAADLADSVFASGVNTVVIVNGLGFADAVSAAPLAALDGAPVLYVEPDSVPTSVQDALHDVLKPTHIVIVGGPAAVSQTVANSLHALTGVTPTRVAGADRYATAEQVALQVAGGSHPAAVYVASGVAFPDALTAAVLAGSAGDPVLLAEPLLPLPAGTSTGMRLMKPQAVIVLGGTLAIADAVMEALPAASAP